MNENKIINMSVELGSLKAKIEAVKSYAASADYPSADVILAILGIEKKESEE